MRNKEVLINALILLRLSKIEVVVYHLLIFNKDTLMQSVVILSHMFWLLFNKSKNTHIINSKKTNFFHTNLFLLVILTVCEKNQNVRTKQG